MNIGENIKKFRKAKGLTQSELAELIGESRVTVTRYENGKRSPSLSKNGLWNYENDKRSPQLSIIEAIAQALEISVPELLGYPPQEIIYIEKDLSQYSSYELSEELFRRMK